MDAGHEFQSEADGILATTMLKPKDHVLNIRLRRFEHANVATDLSHFVDMQE
jgi:hypothetical protein